MHRQLEPELMDDPEGAAAYARADFHDSNDLFVDAVVPRATPALRTVLDLGCGPGDLTIRLAQALPEVSFTAVDGSAPMIALARAAVSRAGLEGRVTLLEERLQALPLAAGTFDAVLSKDLLHHLPDPALLWTVVARLGRPGALVCVMDLVRPATPERARAIVDAVVAHADEILRQDFYNSLLAAFTLDEVREQLSAAGLDLRVQEVSDRHMLIEGQLGSDAERRRLRVSAASKRVGAGVPTGCTPAVHHRDHIPCRTRLRHPVPVWSAGPVEWNVRV